MEASEPTNVGRKRKKKKKKAKGGTFPNDLQALILVESFLRGVQGDYVWAPFGNL